MYGTLLTIHSLVRWLVLLGIINALARSYSGLIGGRRFSAADRRSVAIGTGAGQAQLLVGMALYFSSPFVAAFWASPGHEAANLPVLFFSVIHVAGMLASVVLMSIGASLSKRPGDDRSRFRAVALYWTIAVVIILVTIPWPFSPLAQRPLWRPE